MKPLLAIGVVCLLLDSVAMSQSSEPANSSGLPSRHFIIRTYRGGPEAEAVLRLCEASRIELQRVWCAASTSDQWLPRCEVVVHPSRESYLSVVGQGGGQTRGSSLIHMASGTVVARRIDLLMDIHAGLTALPHELTHVILADCFGGNPPPPWLDEGIAMLADTRQKQLLHCRDCQEALAARNALSMLDLLTLDQRLSPHQMPAFYGQSLTLIQMLASCGSAHKIVAFGSDARRNGYDRALRDHYGINGVHDLERRWKSHVAQVATNPSPPIVTVAFMP